MKKITLLLTVMLFALVGAKAEVTLLSGTGTINDPYLIGTADDLIFMRDQVNAATAAYPTAFYKLTANIDLSGAEWTPIGTTDNYFKGSFDGNSMTITHLKIGVSGTPTSILNAGLFAFVANAIIQNLSIETDGIYASGVTNSGILVGYAVGAIISNCNVTGVLSTTHTTTGAVGGLIGRSLGSKIVNCMADVSLTTNASAGTLNSGGLVGNMSSGTFQGTTSVKSVVYNSYSKSSVYSSTVSSVSYTGGLIGNIAGGGHIYNCYSSAAVKGECTSGVTNVFVGGIIGTGAADMDVKNCIALNSSVTCINPGANRQIGRIAGATVGTAINYDADYALESMVVQSGTSSSTLADVALGTTGITTKQGGDLGSNVPKDLLNAYIAANTAPPGTSWMSWKVIGGINNGNPVLYTLNTSRGSEIQTQSINVYTSNGVLVIEGLDLNKPISVYNMNGQKVWTGFANAYKTEIALAKGIYVLSGYRKLILNY